MTNTEQNYKVNNAIKVTNNDLDGVRRYLQDLYEKQGGSLNKIGAETISTCIKRNDRILASLNSVDKTILLNAIKGQPSQPALYNLIKDLHSFDHGDVVTVPYLLSAYYDSDYKKGMDTKNSPASDGKYYNFGDGAWQLRGDNKPCNLKQAIENVSDVVLNYDIFY